MSLNGALQIGRSAITASQAGLQVTGNNMANAATVGYTRQRVNLSPAHGEQIGPGQFVGNGVRIGEITRQIDVALQARLRDAISSEQGALVDQRFLTAIETLQNELTDNDLSTLLSDFFKSFSELANNPEDASVRSVVIQQGGTLANRISQLRGDYNRVRDEIDRDLGASVEAADDILSRLEQVNMQIAQAEQGAGQANSLRDQRDQLVNELSEHLDVSVVEQPNGMVDVLVGSTPVILAGKSRGIELRRETVDGKLDVSIRLAADQTRLDIDGGRIGALMGQRADVVEPAIDDLDTFAAQLIHQVNRLHSQGQGQRGFDDVTGTYRLDDTTVPMNDAAAGVPFDIENGSFFIHVTNQTSGARTTHQINVDGGTMSLDDLINEINTVVGVPNVTAGVNSANQFTLTAAGGNEISFSDDSSGALAALGVNTFFDGEDAFDIQVNEALENDPTHLAAGSGHVEGSNGTALAIADLQDAPVAALNERSLREFWEQSVSDLAVKTGAANDAVESTRLVRESIEGQVQAVSGVSIDEEAINLLTFQRQFQAAARFITVIDEAMQTLLAMV